MAKREIERSPFGQRLFEARTRAGLKQVPAAAAIGIRQSTMVELERTAQGSRHTTALARLYRCDAHWLATGEGAPSYDQVVQEETISYADNPEETEGSATDWAMFDAFRSMSEDDRERMLRDALAAAERHRKVTAEVLRKYAGKDVEPKQFEPMKPVPVKSGNRLIRKRPASAKKAAAKKQAKKE